MLRPALDHNINGVLESLPSVGIKLWFIPLNFIRRLCHDKALR